MSRRESEPVPDKVALHAREVRFDWTGLTPAFIPNDPGRPTLDL